MIKDICLAIWSIITCICWGDILYWLFQCLWVTHISRWIFKMIKTSPLNKLFFHLSSSVNHLCKLVWYISKCTCWYIVIFLRLCLVQWQWTLRYFLFTAFLQSCAWHECHFNEINDYKKNLEKKPKTSEFIDVSTKT